LNVIVAEIAGPPDVAASVKLVGVTVEASIASLNVALIAVDTGTPLAPATGEVDVTVGGVSSRVVNDNEKIAASPFPATSLAPVVTFAMSVAELGSALVGVNTAVRVAAV